MANEILMPQLGLTMETGTVERWLKKVGEPVKAGEPLIEISTDKLTNTVVSEYDGVLQSIVAPEGTDVGVKSLLGYLQSTGVIAAGASHERPRSTPTPVSLATRVNSNFAPIKTPGERIKVSPLARKTAVQVGVDIAKLHGSGPGGRILLRDVLQAKEQGAIAREVLCDDKKASSDQPTAAATALEPFPDKGLALMEGDVVTKMFSMRRAVASRMFTSAIEIPTVTQTVKADVTALLAVRQQANEKRASKLSVNDFILKAVANALQQHPAMRVSLDGEKIIRRAHVNLGVAVALADGLIVPVIRDADRMSFETLVKNAWEIVLRAREGKLLQDECTGSTFTVSNLGMFGVDSFTSIINQPDAAILGVNSIYDTLVMADSGKVEKRQMLHLSVTYDCRLLDGATVAKFQARVRALLENPLELLFL